MSDPYSFVIRISLVNEEEREDVVFEDTIKAGDESDLISLPLTSQWARANDMAIERSDEGTGWDVDARCIKVTEDGSDETDWENDMMPQRDEVSLYLMEQLSRLARPDA